MSNNEELDRLVAEIGEVPGVVGLHTDLAGGVATYLPGNRVPGVRRHDDRYEVQIVIDRSRPGLETAHDTRDRLEALTGVPVDVVVADVSDLSETPENLDQPLEDSP